ncbi:glycosyltransferase family 4 protein [Collinsella ihumii]|uniref:glycosyltransferase family 4 protein n=1 Tax=Collinsella ihumii TaxID=1720204 RepID=UPI0025AA9E57|nr:glycosyltransferase family 4 protein [Collinsella ihumii]MDN0055083.1 glycosyltransferase family 4 protein [Collinsella ihumii]
MSKDKLLFYMPENKLKSTGGPAGYLYNLRQGLESIDAEGYRFLPPVKSAFMNSKILQRVVPQFIKNKRRTRRLINLLDVKADLPVDLNQYQGVHFHSTEDLYLSREALKSYGGTVLLTSHSPCVYHKELIMRLDRRDANRNADRLKQLEYLDEYAFNRADYVIFPCKEAEEPYFHTWEKYSAVRRETKLRYIPTGIQGCIAKIARQEIRERYCIPQDAFVMSYVGRHNEIKGYDRLTNTIPEILDKSGAWMLVAGRQGPLYPPHHDRWIEIGWTDDPYSLVAASDLFILPNRETFFDLVMLEVLSLGVPILASRTGGNKFFEKFGSRGISLFGDEKGLARAIEEFLSMGKDAHFDASNDNKRLFESEFTCSKFAERYCNLIEETCKGA